MQIKNAVSISLTLFVVIIISILGNTDRTIIPSPAPTPSTGLTPAQVARHNNANDCWMVISGRVYNLTNYIPIHPGGSGQIIPYCGKDATIAFDTKGGRGTHSQSATDTLGNYYVGNLN